MNGSMYSLVENHSNKYTQAANYKQEFINAWINNSPDTISLFDKFFSDLTKTILNEDMSLNIVNTMCNYNICQMMAICITKGIKEADINAVFLKDYYDLDNSSSASEMLEHLKELCLKMIDLTQHTNEISVLSNSVKKCIKHIDDNICSAITLKTISSELNYNSDYISHRFSNEMQIGINEYINIKKVELAKQLLAERKTAKEVASELSYGSPSYFIKTFKKITGLSPKQYQKWIVANKV